MKLDTLIRGRAGVIDINGSRFRYRREDGQMVEGEFSLEHLDEDTCSILAGGRVYRVSAGAPGESIVNGSPVPIELFDPRAPGSRKSSTAAHGRAEIAALMPGKIVSLLVSRGDLVEAGQGLLVVEAMKMQNEMKSPKTGRVVEVRATAGSTVAAGEVLMVVE